MLKVYTDGAARGNPGPAATGYVIFRGNKLLKKKTCYIGKSTNNIAEYKAIIAALEAVPGYEEVILCSDSKLIVNQLNGSYKVKQPHLKKLHQKVFEVAGNVKFCWVPREEPGIVLVDALINEELDKHFSLKSRKLR